MIRRGRTSGTLSDYVDEKVAAWKGGTVGSSKEGSECSVCVGGGGGGVPAQASRGGDTLHTHLHEAAFKVEVPRSMLFSQPQLPVRAEPNALPL